MRDRPNEKIRDMTRSVLPSKARVRARRTKQDLHRSARRRSRMAMEWLDDLDGDDFEDSEGAFYESEDDYEDRTGELRSEISMMVSDRRGADKLGGFLRWAEANTKHLKNDEDKYYAIKQKIGSSVIKDHALGHFIQLDRARNPFYFRSILDYPERPNYYPCPWKTYDQLLNWIREAIELDHARFNDFLRRDTEFKIAPIHACRDDKSRACWTDVPSNRRHHNDKTCKHNGMVQCLASWRKLHTNPADQFEYVGPKDYLRHYDIMRRVPHYPDRPCWEAEMVRDHQESKCPNSRRHIKSVEEAEIAAKHFWHEYHYRNEMNAEEAALVKFFRLKGILE